MRDTPLWKCEGCGRTFANANQTHFCGLSDLEHHFDGRAPIVRELFNHFVRCVREYGPAQVLPEKTRIAFHVRMSFAVLMTRRDHLAGHLVLARRVENPRFTKIETFSPRNHVHHFRLYALEDFDEPFLAFLSEAYAVGEQKHLSR